jgi:hypothetical protein
MHGLTLEVSERLVKDMKLTQIQLERIAHKVFDAWKTAGVVTFKDDEKKVFATAIDHLKADLQKEVDIEREVHKMLDSLEKSNPGEFQRHKMFQLLKQKLAKEKKVVL